uniref:CCHC-type domain-containing protein n=1 Tax=Cannabis sativa TaxID=3483 RepID=A0A803NVA0_CANSA
MEATAGVVRLDEEEEEVLRLPVSRTEEIVIDTRWCLVGKLLTGRVSDFNVFQNMMAFLWQPGMGMYVKELNPNLFLFQFYHEIDIQRVIDGSPWTYDRKPLIFTRLKEGDNPRLVEINHMDMWVQLHNLQSGNMTLSVVTALGNFIGTFIESDPNNFVGVWRDFLRVRVRVNVDKPIKRRMKVSNDDSSWYWVNFKYEKLPTFCFICGKIGHAEKFCPRLFLKPLHLQEKPYNLELRASTQRRHSTFGVQWLRSGAAVRGESSHASHGGSGERGVNLPPMIQEQSVGSAGNILGYGINNNLLNERHQYGENIMGVNEEDLTLNVNNNGNFFDSTITTIIDSKRRRHDSNVGVSMGPQAKVTSGSVDEMEQDRVGFSKNGPLLRMESIRAHLGYEGCFVVEAHGHSGGLALLWKEENEVTIQGFSANHIDAMIQKVGTPSWRFTGIYGEPRRELRFQTWNLFRSLKEDNDLPWCLMGDMNNLGSQLEKKSGRNYPDQLITGFNNALRDCNLIDMALEGYPFTWEKGRNTTDWIEERLDKTLVTNEWLSLFPQSILYNLELSSSDHCPLLLILKGNFPTTTHHSFRFENAWIREPLCKQIIESCWTGSGCTNIQEKIFKCGEMLGKWGRDISGNFRQRINHCKSQIRNSKWGRDPVSVQQHKEGKEKLDEVLAQRETFWKQISKQFWLNSGDKNSKYFHSVASSRKRSNSLSQLMDNNGVWVNWETGLQHVITGYFQDLFQSSNINLSSVLNGVRPTITCDQNNELLEPISEDEVRKALFQMHLDKSPGPDGMTPAFYQKHWSIVGADVVQFVRDFFVIGKFSDSINDTHIVLIPKKKNPSHMSDMRPISLCNVLYKIASKVVANRMKGVLNHTISKPSALSGRLISDNVTVAFEAMHYLKRKTNGKKGYMALKLDMSKAYDRVEWRFLDSILRVMGFSDRWINLTLSCVNSVRYHVINSGQKMGPIVPSREAGRHDTGASKYRVKQERCSEYFCCKRYKKLGLRKRIALGTSPNYHRSWLPSLDHCPLLPMVQGLENFIVNRSPKSTIAAGIGCCEGFFSPPMLIILGIPIDQSVTPLLVSNKFWKILWTLKVPPKAKDLVWRAASNCLATKRNLCIKKQGTLSLSSGFGLEARQFLTKGDVGASNNVVLGFMGSKKRPGVEAAGKKEGDGAEQWIKPSSGIKLNVDAAIFASSFKHGFRMCRELDGDPVSCRIRMARGPRTGRKHRY